MKIATNLYREASELGLPPGKFPKALDARVVGVVCGNVNPLLFVGFDCNGSAIYKQIGSNVKLTVFND